jgi:hypothetical protein
MIYIISNNLLKPNRGKTPVRGTKADYLLYLQTIKR